MSKNPPHISNERILHARLAAAYENAAKNCTHRGADEDFRQLAELHKPQPSLEGHGTAFIVDPVKEKDAEDSLRHKARTSGALKGELMKISLIKTSENLRFGFNETAERLNPVKALKRWIGKSGPRA